MNKPYKESAELKEQLENAHWVCYQCGNKYGRVKGQISTWHFDPCDVCGRVTAVTESRDYNYLRK